MIRLLLTSGRGPTECRIALGKALDRMADEAEDMGLAIDVVRGATRDRHGPASAIAVVDGEGADSFAQTWTGSVLWIAPSPVRPHHKRKNWFIGILRLPSPATAPKPLAAGDVRFEAFRAGGAGGQHQNKTESAVRAVHVASSLAVVVRDQRSQHRNKAAALERLAALLQAEAELGQLADQQAIQAAHDALERGRPVRRFRGDAFVPE